MTEYYIQHDPEDFELWFEYGRQAGYCGPICCAEHDGIPLTLAEEEFLIEGDDICVPILRIYQNRATEKGVIANHPPTVWRDEQRFT